jgi:hypothetical protein
LLIFPIVGVFSLILNSIPLINESEQSWQNFIKNVALLAGLLLWANANDLQIVMKKQTKVGDK